MNVERCHVASPIDEVVLQVFKHVGEQAAAGMPLFQVADVERMTLHCYFTSEQLSRIAVGQHVTIFCDYGGSERANQVYAAKVGVRNDEHIKMGMYGGVLLKD